MPSPSPWGVSRLTVNRWRQALDVARCNAGTTQRHRDNIPLVISAASNRVGLERAHAPTARHKAEATKRERGTIPGKRLWTEEQIGWMGQLTDAAIAQRVGCHPRTVEKERKRHHIPTLPSSQYTEGFEQVDTAKLRARLLELGLTQQQLADRYGCAHSVINAIYSGAKTRVTVATLKKLARPALRAQRFARLNRPRCSRARTGGIKPLAPIVSGARRLCARLTSGVSGGGERRF